MVPEEGVQLLLRVALAVRGVRGVGGTLTLGRTGGSPQEPRPGKTNVRQGVYDSSA